MNRPNRRFGHQLRAGDRLPIGDGRTITVLSVWSEAGYLYVQWSDRRWDGTIHPMSEWFLVPAPRHALEEVRR